MKKYNFLHERKGCIGCNICADMDPKNWKMNETDGKSDLINCDKIGDNEKKNFEKGELNKNKEVAECCPVNVIHIYDNEEKII